ncbi:MAG: DNA polymerase I, partial [Pseudohongiellaceae bacterium]
MAKSKELVLVDGSSYLFRAFHALPPLVTSRGQPTGAVKGVINMIRALIREHDQANVAIVFDAKGKTFRNEIYGEYKAHRPPMPDELRSQIEPIHEIVRAMGLPLLIEEGVEADDVIGTLARQAEAQGTPSLISTGDKDLAQLVTGRITLVNTMTNEILDTAGVIKKFGIGPHQIVDYLALMGDKSDNIPGVPGVGPKTALKWLQEYESMEGIIANADRIGGKIGERLRENLDMLRLSYELATIKDDVKLNYRIRDLVKTEDEPQKLYDLYTAMEFRTWVNELEEAGVSGTVSATSSDVTDAEADAEISVQVSATQYETVTDEAALTELLKTLAASGRFSLKLESAPAHYLDATLLGLAVSNEPGRAWYVPLGHEEEKEEQQQLDEETVLAALKPLLENPEITKVGHDLKWDRHVLANYGIELQPLKSDVLLASYVLNSTAIKHQLNDIARYYLDLTPIELESLLGKGRKKLQLAQISSADYMAYAAEQADLILRLGIHLEQTLAREGHLLGVYQYYELPLIEALQTVERNGIRLDKEILAKQSKEIEKQIASLQEEVFEQAGEEFNLGSPKQLQSILFEKLGLPVLKKTGTGQPSTAEPILQELAEQYPLPHLILEHRSLSKLKSTYTDKLPLQVNARTGRIHTTFQQAVAATGRLSSTEPNLQNIPIRSEAGRRVRTAFVPAPGYKLLAADYSQVELRIMAHLSRDPGLTEAFNSDADVHKATAADVFGVALEAVTPEQRRSAKAINFGLIYGMSAFGLANQIGVSRSEAAEYVERYFEKYPGVRRFMDETRALADEKGYVETIFGRRLYLPDLHAGNAMIRRAAQRTAINAPMQGSAADIIKRAMIDIHHWFCQSDLDVRMVLQVHDELVFEVSEADVDLVTDGVKFRMISAASLDVPLVVDVGVGNNWD